MRGASSADRVSLTSGEWFTASEIGDDDEVSFEWTDPNSASDDNFFVDVVDDGLVGWWQMDGDWTDSSGNGNDGTASGATFADGKVASAGSFDGVDDGVTNNDGGFLPTGDSPENYRLLV